MSDPVNYVGDVTDGLSYDDIAKPMHYTTHPSGKQCIEFAERLGFNLGNAFKYLWRRNAKSEPLINLRKALWYVTREIARGATHPVPQCLSAVDDVIEVIGYEPYFVGVAMLALVRSSTKQTPERLLDINAAKNAIEAHIRLLESGCEEEKSAEVSK